MGGREEAREGVQEMGKEEAGSHKSCSTKFWLRKRKQEEFDWMQALPLVDQLVQNQNSGGRWG